MPLRKRSQAWNDIADTEACRHAHPEQPAQFTALANTVLRLVEGCQNWLDPRQEFCPGFGRYDGARGTRQQFDPKLGLEVRDDAGGLRLRQTAFPCGGRKAA